MTSSLRILTGLALVGAVLAAAFLFVPGNGGLDTPPPAIEENAGGTGIGHEGAGDPELGTAPGGDQIPQRIEVPLGGNGGRSHLQGITGQVVDSEHHPLPAVAVYLVESPLNNLAARRWAFSLQVSPPPVARAETAGDGTFDLGLRRSIPGRTYEVHVVCATHADRNIPHVTIPEESWTDLGEIVLELGATVRGRVTVADTGLPVPGATIALRMGQGFDPSIPERLDGLTATADGAGHYEIPHAPLGLVAISAVAPHFARENRDGVQLAMDRVNQIDFTLLPGKQIEGHVTDPAGRPIPGATVFAYGVAKNARQNARANSAADGSFRILGLRPGGFTLHASARGFQRWTGPAFPAGTVGVHAILEPKRAASLRVTTPEGVLLPHYQVTVRRHFPRGNDVGQVPDLLPQRVGPDDRDAQGWVRVEGLDQGLFVFQVNAKGYAKSFSDPFEVVPNEQDPAVEMVVSRGTRITGSIVDAAGRPVAGAVVESRYDGRMDNALEKILGAGIPRRTTRRKVRTAADGSFSIERLSVAAYQLEVLHPDFCKLVHRAVIANGEPLVDVGPLTMTAGTLVFGFASFAGAPAGQIRVLLSTSSTIGMRPAGGLGFHTEAVTGNDGSYRLALRVPPGTYEIKAMRQTAENFFLAGLDARRSVQRIHIPRGQAALQVDLDIPAH